MIIKDFKALKISLASPDQILSWSHGEVKKAETINYRTQRSEVDGLMCEKIFGPTKNYECYCGKYKKIRYKGIICDKCGVEVTTRSVRRERMGHIKLASPVTHIWFVHEVPNKLALLLDIPQKKIANVIYFSRYMVTDIDEEAKKKAIELVKEKIAKSNDVYKKALDEKISVLTKENKDKVNAFVKEDSQSGKSESSQLNIEKINFEYRQKMAKLKEEELLKYADIERYNNELFDLVKRVVPGEVISEEECNNLFENGFDFFKLSIGAEAIRTMLKRLDLDDLSTQLYKDINAKSVQKRVKVIQRLKIVEGLRKNNMKPEWMVLDVIPVIPPDLRPIIQLSGGRFATSDLNDLYRRVINRNNRLKKLIDLGAPDVILRNEKRMLQESVDTLFDNSHRSSPPVVDSRGVPLKSLSDNIRGKHGRFRENLLGKRVDYSGRAVIVSGPNLNLHQCGLPKKMALELFRPFVIKEILARGLATNIKSAKVLFESSPVEVWDILEEVIQNRPVLLNRAPTLHKQGIQAFFPVLIDGNAIQLHPLVCTGFNADFDGDQMAVHVPLSDEAVEEAKNLIMVENNLFLSADSSPVVTLQKDMIYGCYYLTSLSGVKYDKCVFDSFQDAISACEKGYIHFRDLIKVRYNSEIIETTVGRIMFNEVLPKDLWFINEVASQALITKIIVTSVEKVGNTATLSVLDGLKYLGFKYATVSDLSIAMSDCEFLPDKDKLISAADDKIINLTESYNEGLITKKEKVQLSNIIWNEVTNNIAEASLKNLSDTNPLKAMVLNKFMGANIDQLKQIVGMKGLVVDPNSNIVELPIKSNYAEGLSAFEYLVEARSSRKGLADVALKTSDTGYLTRRMVDVAHDVIIREEDCKNFGDGYEVSKNDKRKLPFEDRIYGRVLAKDLKVKGGTLFEANTIIDRKIAKEIFENPEVTSIFVRTPLTCGAQYGLCSMCYGFSMSEPKIVSIGTAVGVIAAQSLGQKGMQLTLNSKHVSGIVGGVDMTQGYPRIEELLEARIPKGEARVSDIDGVVSIENSHNQIKVIVNGDKKIKQDYILVKTDVKAFEGEKKVMPGSLLFTTKNGSQIVSPFKGLAKVEKGKISVESDKVKVVEYVFPKDESLLVVDGEKIFAGSLITKGNVDPNILLRTVGMIKAQKYIIDNLISTYEEQGITVHDKHIEIIVAQMGRYVRVTDPGDSDVLPGSYKDIFSINAINKSLQEQGKSLLSFERKISGITVAALHTESFLSAASFQEQVRVLSDVAISGSIDYLRGLKENVIIGRKIPTGENARLVNE